MVKEIGNDRFLQAGANDANASDETGRTGTNVGLAGNIVEVEPSAVFCCYDALCTEHDTAGSFILQSCKDSTELVSSIFCSGLDAPAGEDLVCMVVMVVTAASAGTFFAMIVVMMLVVMVVAALALLIVIVVVMLVVMMVAALALLVMIVVMVLVIMMVAALALLVVIVVMMLVVMMVAALALLVVIVVMMLVVMMVAALAFLVMIMVVMVMAAAMGTSLFFGESVQLSGKGGDLFHRGEDLRSVQLIPRCGDNDCVRILFTQESNGIGNLLLGAGLGVAENDSACMGNLIVIELAEVFHIHLALVGVGDSSVAVQHHVIGKHGFHRTNNVGELAYTRRLDEDTVGSILGNHLCQRFGKVAYQGAADATGVHFVDGDARILQEASVNADLAELILDEDNLLSGVCFGQEFFDQRGFTGTQKAGEYIDFGHYKSEPFL